MGVAFAKQSSGPITLQVIDEHGGGIECMSVSEDQSVLATGSQDNTVRLWSLREDDCQCLHVLRGHFGRITSVVISEDSVVSASVDKTIRRWDVLTGDCLFVCNGHLAQINRVLCTGDFIFSASYDRTARCWDMDTGECLRVFRGHQRGIFSLMYVPVDADEDENSDNPDNVDGAQDILITVSADGTGRSWSLDTAHTLRVFSGHSSSVTCLTTDHEGQTLFTGSMDMTVRSWVLKSGRPLLVFRGHEGPVLHIVVVNKTLYSTSSDATGRAWLKDLGEPLQTYRGHTRSVAKILIHQGVAYTASSDGRVHSYDSRNGTLKNKFVGHEYAVNCIQVVGDKLFSASDDGTIRVWSLSSSDEKADSKSIKDIPLRSASCPPLSAKSRVSVRSSSLPRRPSSAVDETVIN